jgi:DNA-binding HxlR family transcriptional regulator
MRELMMGPRRFGDLRANISALSANVLTQRLAGLEAAGIVRRRKLPPPASVQVYELSDWGLAAEPILLALGRWGVRSPAHDPTRPLSPVALMLSFRAKFEPARAKGLNVSIAFRFGEEAFTAAVRKGVLLTERGAPVSRGVELAGTPSAVAALVYGKAPLKELEAQGALSVVGDRTALKRFANLFELPPKASERLASKSPAKK